MGCARIDSSVVRSSRWIFEHGRIATELDLLTGRRPCVVDNDCDLYAVGRSCDGGF